MIEALQRLWLRLTGWRCVGHKPVVANRGIIAQLGYDAAVTEAARMAVREMDRSAARPNGDPRPGYRTYLQRDGEQLIVSVWHNPRHAQTSL